MFDPGDQCNSGIAQAQAFRETLMLHGVDDRGLKSGREFISDTSSVQRDLGLGRIQNCIVNHCKGKRTSFWRSFGLISTDSGRVASLA